MRYTVLHRRQRVRRYWMPLIALTTLFAIAGTIFGLFPRNITHAAAGDWTTYLGSNARTGFNGAETAITATTAATLKLLWKVQTTGHISSEPLVANGALYWGGWDGIMHETNPATGQDLWTTPLGVKLGSCGTQSFGVVGTATIATESISGTPTQVVYVGAGQDNLYALNAQTGAVLWQTNLGNTPAEIIYDSPAVYNGSVYIGVSSSGDCPLMQGALYQVNASTGAIQHTFDVVPGGCIGAGIWGSPTIDNSTGTLYFGTGNADPLKCQTTEPLASSIVEVRASDLSLVSSWQFTPTGTTDADVGSTPTLFNATIGGSSHAMMGVESKDGNYYAFDRSAIGNGPLWKVAISVAGRNPELGLGSISSSAYDGTHLYVAGGNTTINGAACQGSLRALDPNTGNFIWQVCRNNPALDGVIAVPGLVVSGAGNTIVVANSATGNIVYSFTDTDSNAKFWGSATISNGVLYAGSRSGDLFALGLGSPPSCQTPATPCPSPNPSPSPTATPGTLQSGPVNKTWYFAEGRVGGGFNEYLSMDNPTANACAVKITYLYTPDRGVAQTKTVPVTIPANTRYEEGVDGDLGTTPSGPGVTDSAMIAVDSTGTPACTGIVAERPMYFNALGANASSDVLGMTHLATTFTLADVAVGAQPGGGFSSSFITILNPPGGQAATVTATYYSGGVAVGTDTVSVPAGTRGTIFPNTHTPALPAHVSVVVTSTQPVAVERPTYFSHINGGNAGTVSGGADVIGVAALSNDWLFAEGYTGGQFQEQFVIANLDTSANATASVSIQLELPGGPASPVTVSVPTLSQLTYNVNLAAPNQNVSAEITSSGARIVVEREMFFRYAHNGNGRLLVATGGTDVIGQAGPATHTLYSFAEGYTNAGYDQWLTLQNPTATPETVWITLSNALGRTYTYAVVVGQHARATQDMVQVTLTSGLYRSGDTYKAFEISMTVQTAATLGGPFVAERPMYSNVNGNQGGTDILGYTGG